MTRPTRSLAMPKATQKMRRLPSTAQGRDIVTATEEQSKRVVNLYHAIIAVIEPVANESANRPMFEQRQLPLRELRSHASLLKRSGALLDKIIQERVASLAMQRLS